MRRRRWMARLAAVTLAAGLVTVAPVAAHAGDKTVAGWVRVTAAPTGQPLNDVRLSYNSEGAENYVRHDAVGMYTVVFGGLGVAGGNAHVMAVDFNRRSCQLLGWYQTPGGEAVRVLCFDWTGARSDSGFTANFASGNFTGTYTSIFSDLPSGSGVHVPDPTNTYDAGGGTPTVQRLSVGAYAVSIPSLRLISPSPLESYQVTAVSFEARLCRIVLAVRVDIMRLVACTDEAGRPADSTFTLRLVMGADLLNRRTGGFSYAVVADPSTVEGDVPAFNSAVGPGTINVRRAGVGYYILRIHFPASLSNGGHVMIVADSARPRYCISYGWQAYAPDQYVGVLCYDPTTDTAADSGFVIGYTQM